MIYDSPVVAVVDIDAVKPLNVMIAPATTNELVLSKVFSVAEEVADLSTAPYAIWYEEPQVRVKSFAFV